MPQPGWYSDPDGSPERLRWWDGTRWTEHVHGEAAPAGAGATRRRGVWPWVALVTTAGLVVAVGFGLGAGLLRLDSAQGTPVPPGNSTDPVATEPWTPSPRPTPTTTLAPASPAPSYTPVPWPTITRRAPTVTPADHCPEASGGSLTDGYVRLDVPADWVPVDGRSWLECPQAAASPWDTSSVTVGSAAHPSVGLEDAAEFAWAIALLDAATPLPLSHNSAPVTVAGMEGWMVNGSVGSHGHVDDLTVVVLDAGGAEPTVVVASVDATDEDAVAAIQDILDSLGPA